MILRSPLWRAGSQWTTQMLFRHHESGSGCCRDVGCPASKFLCSRYGKESLLAVTPRMSITSTQKWKSCILPFGPVKRSAVHEGVSPKLKHQTSKAHGDNLWVWWVPWCEVVESTQGSARDPMPNCTTAATPASLQDSLKANTGCASSSPEDALGNSPTRCHRHSPYSPPSVFHLYVCLSPLK